MKPPILNHVALTVPRSLVRDTPERRNLLDFYESAFGWRAIDVMAIEGERIVLHLHQVTHFLYLVGGDEPSVGRSGDSASKSTKPRPWRRSSAAPRPSRPSATRRWR